MSNITSQTLLVININNITCSVMLNDSTDVTVVVSKVWLCIWKVSLGFIQVCQKFLFPFCCFYSSNFQLSLFGYVQHGISHLS